MKTKLLSIANFKKYLLLFVAISFSWALTAQTPEWVNYRMSNTSTTLAGNYINAIAVDLQGNKWFGTNDGISKYDGTHWTTYTTADGLTSNQINAIVIDAQGNVLVGTANGVSKYDGIKWTVVHDYYNVLDMVMDSQGNLLIATRGQGVWRFDDSGSWFLGLGDEIINAIAIDKQGNIWCGTFSGVAKFDGSSWSKYTTSDGISSNYVNTLAIDTQGKIWCGTNDGLCTYDGSWTNDYSLTEIKKITIDAQGNKWIATNDGIVKLNNSSRITYTVDNGLINNDINTIAIDVQGNKWIGTTCGVSKFDGSTWTNFNSNGLVGNYVKAIAIDAMGNKWVGTSWLDIGSSKFNDTTWSACIYNYDVNAITIDTQGNKWFGTTQGAFKFDGKDWTDYTTVDGLVGNSVHSITIDTHGNIWFGTWSGVGKFDGSHWTRYKSTDGLVDDRVNSIAIDANGNKWIATENGVSKFNDTTWTTYNTFNGLANNRANAVAIDLQGNTWFATGNGVSKFGGDHWTTYRMDSMASDNVNAIAIDAQGDKWFGTNTGIKKFDDVKLVSYSYLLANRDVISICIDKKGNKWFGTSTDGILKFHDGGAGPLEYKRIQVGNVFIDKNENGIKDVNEQSVSGEVIFINNNRYAATQNNGLFYTTLNNGTNTFLYKPKDNWALTTDSVQKIQVNESTILDTIYFGVKPVRNIDDASINIVGTATRLGFKSQYWINYKNEGTVIQNGRVVFNLDSRIKILNTVPQADTLNANRVVWNFTKLESQESRQLYLFTQIPSTVLLNDTLISSANIIIGKTDGNLTNNTNILKQRITGSYDPNDKLVTPEGIGDEKAVPLNTPLTYTIRFQNTGTDTAFNVNILDTLNANLDVGTLSIVAASHPVNLELRSPNEAIFHFENILLPDSHTNESGSNGFIKYSILPKANLHENTVITNKANIYFDFNPPVATNEVKNTLVSATNKKSQSISFDLLPTKVYGDPSFNLTATSNSGLPVSFSSSNTSVASVSGNSVTIVNAGTAILTASQPGNEEYDAAIDSKQTLTINKALLTAKADDKTRKPDEPNPPFTISYSGFVNNETIDVIDVKPTTTCIANISSSPGTYPIWVADGKDNNYTFIYLDGNFVIQRITGVSGISAEDYQPYPNPAGDYVIIKGAKPFTVVIHDLSGKKLMDTVLEDEALNISSLSKGVYILTIQGVNYKLIKQ